MGLCPITEANLGGAVLNSPQFIFANGTYGIGSDSNINISLNEELHTLKYSQRLFHRERNVLVNRTGSTGGSIYLSAAKGGAQALGRACGTISVGQLADLVAIDNHNPALRALSRDQILDGLVFAPKDHVVQDVWSAGRRVVHAGQHVNETQITERFRKTLLDLKERLR